MSYDNSLLDALRRYGERLTRKPDELLEGKNASAGAFAGWLRQQNTQVGAHKILDQALSHADADPGAALYLLSAFFEANRDRAILARAGASRNISRATRALIGKLAGCLTRDAFIRALVTPPAPSPGFSRFAKRLPVQEEPAQSSPLPEHWLPGRPVLEGPLPEALASSTRSKQLTPLTQPVPRVRRPDPEMLRRVLVDEFPWLELAITKFVAPFEIAQRTGQAVLRLPPILLAGPPGVGKSALVRAFANAARLPLFVAQAGAGHEASNISGLSRSWRAAEPSLPVRSIAGSGVANPLICVDEIDKSVLEGGAQFGRVVDALLALLEKTTARSWIDPYLGAPIDLSDVNWILLVNDPGVLPSPLCSRLRLIRAPAPSGRHAQFLIENPREVLAKEAGLAVEAIPLLSPPAERRITLDLDRHGDIRRFNRLVSAALNASEWPSIH
jgi:hypothetical protein